MLNNIVIWRPFEDLTESIECLHLKDLRLIARLQCSMVIKEFISALAYGKAEVYTPLIDNNFNIQYYWNNGQPYLCDLVEYYRLAQWHNRNEGGDDYDYFTDPETGDSKLWWEFIDNNEYRENWSNWNSEHSLTHLIALMERNYFWYKRFGMEYKDLKFINDTIYTKSGRPRQCNPQILDRITYKVNRESYK